MKATGVVRKIDDLGRICLPKELRETMNMKVKDPVEIYVDGENIILKKYEPGCIFCGNMEVVDFKGKKVCDDCIADFVEENWVVGNE